jgi:hypothetical protein
MALPQGVVDQVPALARRIPAGAGRAGIDVRPVAGALVMQVGPAEIFLLGRGGWPPAERSDDPYDIKK